MPYLDSLDIANRALQHVGAGRILSVDEDSKNNLEVSSAYDKVRRAEMRRNVWRFGIRNAVLRAIDTTTLLLQPQPWDAAVTYLPGSIVADDNGILWISTLPANLNNDPNSTTVWDQYFGPMTASLYDSTTTYSAGELAYKTAGNPGGYVVFLSMQNANADDPATTTAWSAASTYGKDDIVSYLGSQYRSLIALNTNITPNSATALWDATVTYTTSQKATGSDGFVYSSVGSGNIGHDPTTDGGVHWTNTGVANAWTTNPVPYPSSTKWTPLFASLANIRLVYPIGSGPSTELSSKNVFHLPSGFLREAPQDPKAGAVSFLGFSPGSAYNDWLIQGDYFTSTDVGPVIFRFAADVQDVRKMDDLFCEGFAARIAVAVCEPLTQSAGKLQAIESAYNRFMGEARTVNAIEVGSEEPAEDDWIACRR